VEKNQNCHFLEAIFVSALKKKARPRLMGTEEA
jgi:hypothetical protein